MIWLVIQKAAYTFEGLVGLGLCWFESSPGQWFEGARAYVV